jgi:hypothetical protein
VLSSGKGRGECRPSPNFCTIQHSLGLLCPPLALFGLFWLHSFGLHWPPLTSFNRPPLAYFGLPQSSFSPLALSVSLHPQHTHKAAIRGTAKEGRDEETTGDPDTVGQSGQQKIRYKMDTKSGEGEDKAWEG